MLTPENIALIRTSFKQVLDAHPELFEDFYTRLFVTEPGLRSMFPSSTHSQAMKLEAVIQTALSALDMPDTLLPLVRKMGEEHAGYGVKNDQYQLVSEVLLDTLAASAGPLWTAETSAAWGAVLGVLIDTMIEGADQIAA